MVKKYFFHAKYLSTKWVDYVEEPMKYQALRPQFFSMGGGWWGWWWGGGVDGGGVSGGGRVGGGGVDGVGWVVVGWVVVMGGVIRLSF